MDTLIPAYGRDYNNREAVETAVKSGVDFIHAESGRYCSCRDFAGTSVVVRYAKQRKAAVVKIP